MNDILKNQLKMNTKYTLFFYINLFMIVIIIYQCLQIQN